ncbi:MAG: GyrI-like domain-containing protein [Erysipelotrichaceae bacterium]|nr:GyrI-like domain-containing protein [Erysipelotrichaceae bacterium]
MTIDFKKTEKNLYLPSTTPSIIDVPLMTFITVDGKGDPNTSLEYTKVVELLYNLSYTIKMTSKKILEYVVLPLEGLWSVDDDFRGSGEIISDKSKFIWTMMIRQPDFVTEDVFEVAKAALQKKKPNLDISKARLKMITEGLCVQVMHIGSYDDEPKTILKLDGYARENGYVLDINESRLHHEIYISDPRKVASDKLKTVLRHPIKKG